VADDPREALLAVARDIIDTRGYLGLSLRTASAAAGITPEVARRYYRNRDQLFAAALKLPIDPTTAIPTLVAPGIEGMGERLVRFMLDILKDPEARREIVSLARTGVNAGHALTGLQDFLEKGIVDRLAAMIGVPDARMRSALITSYLLGIAMTRYGARLEPLASASEEEVIRMVAPVIQDLLDPRKPIPGSARARARAGSVPAAESAAPTVPRTFEPDPKAAAVRTAAAAAAAASASRRTAGAAPRPDAPAGGTTPAPRRTPEAPAARPAAPSAAGPPGNAPGRGPTPATRPEPAHEPGPPTGTGPGAPAPRPSTKGPSSPRSSRATPDPAASARTRPTREGPSTSEQ
jgi:AcrR family transcriptional regulator